MMAEPHRYERGWFETPYSNPGGAGMGVGYGWANKNDIPPYNGFAASKADGLQVYQTTDGLCYSTMDGGLTWRNNGEPPAHGDFYIPSGTFTLTDPLTTKVENRGNFYHVNNELAIALTKMDLEVATEIINAHPQKVIALDRLFANNDELKTNTALQMRDAGVEFRTI